MSILTGSDLFGYNKEIIEKTFDKMEQNHIDFGIKFGNETSNFIRNMSKCYFNSRIQTIFDTSSPSK